MNSFSYLDNKVVCVLDKRIYLGEIVHLNYSFANGNKVNLKITCIYCDITGTISSTRRYTIKKTLKS